MNFPNIRDVLTSFSPALDYLALSTGDGRIKIWDTVKGQVQTEFADLATAEETNLYTKVGKGHLSVDFTCMKWLSLEKKKKRKFGTSLLILGTGSGDVLALDVAAGQLNWRISDCHPGGVSAVASSRHASCIYSSGADGMICEIDPHTGNLMRKLKASTKAISCLSVSPDGKVLATASAQLKTFNCSNHKKIQKFTGHPGGVRCMAFSEDGKYILSSATGERYIALWKTGGAKKQSASCVLAMEHPPVFLDSQCLTGEQGLHVLAISEIGVCYFWHGSNLEELSNVKPTKVSLPIEDSLLQRHKGSAPTIFAAKLQGILKPGSAHAFIAFGLLVKPSFQKMLLQFGSDLVLNASKDGVLLPIDHSGSKAKKGLGLQSKVTALDRAHAEDALLPVPIVADLEDTCVQQNLDTYMITDVANQGQAALDDGNAGPLAGVEMSPETFCMEDRLKSLGILSSMDESSNLSHSSIIEGIDFEANLPEKKIRSAVLSMAPSSACKTLETLVALWQTRAGSGSHLLPWIYNILMNHSHHIISEELKNHRLLDTLLKITKSRGMALQQLLQLSGRLQLVTAQIDKTANQTPSTAHEEQMDESDADEDVEDHFYGEDDNESELSSDDEKGDTRME